MYTIETVKIQEKKKNKIQTRRNYDIHQFNQYYILHENNLKIQIKIKKYILFTTITYNK